MAKVNAKSVEVKYKYHMTATGDIFKNKNNVVYMKIGDANNDEAVRLCDGMVFCFGEDEEITFIGEVTITRE